MSNKSRKSKLIEALDAIRRDFESAVLLVLETHSEWPYWRVGEQVGLSESFVLRTAKKNNISRPAGPRPQTVNPEEGGN